MGAGHVQGADDADDGAAGDADDLAAEALLHAGTVGQGAAAGVNVAYEADPVGDAFLQAIQHIAAAAADPSPDEEAAEGGGLGAANADTAAAVAEPDAAAAAAHWAHHEDSTYNPPKRISARMRREDIATGMALIAVRNISTAAGAKTKEDALRKLMPTVSSSRCAPRIESLDDAIQVVHVGAVHRKRRGLPFHVATSAVRTMVGPRTCFGGKNGRASAMTGIKPVAILLSKYE